MHSSIRKPASEYVDYKFVTKSKIIYTYVSTGSNQVDSKVFLCDTSKAFARVWLLKAVNCRYILASSIMISLLFV